MKIKVHCNFVDIISMIIDAIKTKKGDNTYGIVINSAENQTKSRISTIFTGSNSNFKNTHQ